ncbi:MAG: hypothetical protein IJN90_00010 [Bacilli bacterium]|nr:hypothetical protein [Bacilli bacterium]
MTYYEWINYFDSLKDKPISDEPINLINNSNINYQGNIRIRYLNHIVKLINYRLNNALDNFLLKSRTITQDKNNLSIELNDLKKEIIYAKKLASIKYFEEDVKNQLLENIKKFGLEINTAIKDSYINCNDNEIIMLINSIDFTA